MWRLYFSKKFRARTTSNRAKENFMKMLTSRHFEIQWGSVNYLRFY